MREVCVVGAGVVGVTTAWFLAEAGFKVRMIDRSAMVGTGASYLNGGQLSYRYVSPLADAGVPLKALRWLTEQDGPLRFRPTADMSQWLWLYRFLKRCHGKANRETTEKLARLGEYSRQQMDGLRTEHRLDDFDWRQAGKLIIYRSPRLFERAARQLLDQQQQTVLDAATCIEREPVLASLNGRLAGGIYTRDEAVADCQGFCLSLMRKLNAHPNFLGMSVDEALGFAPDTRGRVTLHGRQDVYGADDFVLCAGVGSLQLAESLGMTLPIYPLKGYSLTAPIGTGHAPPAASITDFERKVLYARIGERLRVTAMVDLVGHKDDIDPSRIGSLLRIARNDMPLAGDYTKAIPWAGLRPATPDGAPIVGPSGIPGVWFNLGHGPLGFTFATGTAGILTALMQGRSSPLVNDQFC